MAETYNIGEAKTHWSRLLQRVEDGEEIVIARAGKPIARLVPDEERRNAEAREAMEEIRALRKRVGKAPLQQLLDARHEGHKY